VPRSLEAELDEGEDHEWEASEPFLLFRERDCQARGDSALHSFTESFFLKGYDSEAAQKSHLHFHFAKGNIANRSRLSPKSFLKVKVTYGKVFDFPKLVFRVICSFPHETKRFSRIFSAAAATPLGGALDSRSQASMHRLVEKSGWVTKGTQ
jgi:hypothetical protein